MGALAAPLMIAGTLFQGVSAFGQAQYQAQVARNNAQIAAYNANVASQQAQIQQMRSDREYAAQRGQYLAEAGASGVSALGASQQAVGNLITRAQGEAATDIRRQGEAQSIDFNNKAAQFQGQANAAHSAGITSLIGSVFKAAGQGIDAYGPGSGDLGSSKPRRQYPWSS